MLGIQTVNVAEIIFTFLDIVIGKSTSILQLFTSKDESLLIRRNALFVLDLGLHVLDGIGCLYLEGNGLTREGFHKDLHGRSDLPGLFGSEAKL